jgi:hypothetical protein
MRHIVHSGSPEGPEIARVIAPEITHPIARSPKNPRCDATNRLRTSPCLTFF